MPQIYITALLTTLLALGMIGLTLWRLAPVRERPVLAAALLLELPMCFLAFQVLRMPLNDWLVDQNTSWYTYLTILYAPLTEEPAKLWLLLVPTFRATLTRDTALKRALAVGLGFGIGEMWLIAWWIAHSPTYASLPWYMFGGYIGERFMVCVIHGLMTAAALRFYPRAFPLGVLLAMSLHFLGNFPILLAGRHAFGLSKEVWMIVLQVYVPLFLVGLAALACVLYGISFAQFNLALSGRAKCPECGHVYVRPTLGLNFGDLRYEPCAGCLRWHWTTSLKETPPT